jgi:tryptophan-rich sensory protein
MFHILLHFIISAAIVASIALISRYYTKTDTEWYKCIQPSITPPKIMFPIVWTTIYVLLVVILTKALVNGDGCIVAILLTNLGLSAFWCYLFFEQRFVTDAMIIIFILWFSIVLVMLLSGDILITILMIPYFIWVTYAMVLNAMSIPKLKQCKDKN